MYKSHHPMLSLVGAIALSISLLILVLAALDTHSPPPVQAAPRATTWYVDGAGDDGNDCQTPGTACKTVNAALGKASDGDTVLIASGVYTENLVISKDLSIIGAGMETTILDGNRAGRTVSNQGQTSLQNLTVRNGLETSIYGGGIHNTGDLTLENTLIISNSSSTGAGVHNRGVLRLKNSAVLSNTATGSGGGIHNHSSSVMTITNSLIARNTANSGAGLENDRGIMVIEATTIQENYSRSTAGGIFVYGGQTTITATTIHHNTTDGSGGGIVNAAGIFTITNSTISQNNAVSYGGVYIWEAAQTVILNSSIAYNHKSSLYGAGGVMNASPAVLHWKNSLVANNDGYQCLGSLAVGWISEGHNLSSDHSCEFTQTSDLQSVNPLLAPLGDYGGATLTHAPLPGSPAIDAGDNTRCPAVDQRGVPRPVDGNNDGTATCDIGSYEARNQITISDIAIGEGDSGFTQAAITVTLTPTSAQAVTVAYATAPGTAVPGVDFNAGSDAITFAPGQQTQFITVTVIGDTDDEGDETFFVNLSAAQGADLIDSQALCSIVDDDGLSSLTINDQTVSEGDTGSFNAVFEVTLSPASDQTVTVDYTTTAGTALPGSDYLATSGTLTFMPGETAKPIPVTIYGDIIDEGESEAFMVDLSGATNANLDDGQGLGLITDNDLAKVAMQGLAEVREGNTGTTTAPFTITLTTPTAFTVTVDYLTLDGYESAEAGSDYAAMSGTLTFTPGVTLLNVHATIYGDTDREPDEIFNLRLNNSSPINIQTSTAIARILNDDFYIYLPLVLSQ
ncbi:MAG: hypothetical protein JW892_11275 [Anaerolineae bacterium]|nr:hypothetical protein [Anaerolineae bacterium]